MKAYISVSFSKRQTLNREINVICETLAAFKITPFVFVDNYNFHPSEEEQMMQQAMKDIDDCDILLAETSDKAIGTGIEAGYAKAKQKPVIYLRSNDAEHSTTLSGISDHHIIYLDACDLEKQLEETVTKLSLIKCRNS